jgi:UPF0271 protein
MGEGIGNDAELMPLVSSANIACGYHAGDHATILKTARLARRYKVSIGAHPSFPDKENFGRVKMKFSANEIYDMVVRQINIVDEIVRSIGSKLNHVKPHGALYNLAAINKKVAHAIVSAIKNYDSNLIFFGLANSKMIDVAIASGLNFKHEVFADRTYQDDGTLTPRTKPNALITNEEDCIEQVLGMVKNKTVNSVNGRKISIQADTICIHGDGEHAVRFAKVLHAKLKQEEINIASQ